MRSGVRFVLLVVLVGAVLSVSCTAGLRHLGVTDPESRALLRGSYIAFATKEGVHLARGDASDANLLIPVARVGDGAAIFLPRLSPDERRLLFFSITDLDVRDSTGAQMSLNLVEIDHDRRHATRWHRVDLAGFVPPDGDGRQRVLAISAADWSADGERIAVGLALEGRSDRVALFDVDGRPTKLFGLTEADLPPVGSLSWSRDGTSIILEIDGGTHGEEAHVARLLLETGSSGSAMLETIAPGASPAVSPQGRIAIVDPKAGLWDFVLLGSDGEEIERFRRPAGRAPSRPFWSPDGRFLYYHSLAATGPLGLIEMTMLRCLDTRDGTVFDLVPLR